MEIFKVKDMYFKDHTHYSYNLNKPLKMIVNIGWLSSEHSYEMGDTEPEFIEKLTEIISNDDIYDYTFNRIRCNTPCNLCKESILQPYINKKRNLILAKILDRAYLYHFFVLVILLLILLR